MRALLDIVAPVFGVVLAGYLAHRQGFLDDGAVATLNRFVYFIALPPLLFLLAVGAPLLELLHGPFLATYLGGILATLAVAEGAARLWFKRRSPVERALHDLAAVFSNTVYMGIPLFLAAFGPGHMTPILSAALASNLLLIGAAVAAIEAGRSHRHGAGAVLRQVAQALGRNPVVLSLLAGVLASWLAIPLSSALLRGLEFIGGAAAPTALFALGAGLYGRPLLAAYPGEVVWLALLKLALNPLFTWALGAYWLALDPFRLKAAVLIAAIPTGALVFVVAQHYGIYVQRSAAVVTVTTALSVVTLTVLLAVL